MDRLETYISALRERCGTLPDKRTGKNGRYTMADLGLAAFSVFLMQSPSFLAHQRVRAHGHGRSNAHSLLGMTALPCDNPIRGMLDGAPTDHFDPVFSVILKDLDAAKALDALRRLDGPVLIALDGSEHFCSRTISCPPCATRRRGEETEYVHSFVGATLVAPEHKTVLPLPPLPPEFVRPHDGAAKPDCEPKAARRWLERVGRGLAWLQPIDLGDALSANQPMCTPIQGGRRPFHPDVQADEP